MEWFQQRKAGKVQEMLFSLAAFVLPWEVRAESKPLA